ncbi:MAG TPA: tetratricopeptide repeat protein [Gemmataceae bacterium]|nr:tetratricopeptide repeat protein [Gemmataceae bacterium]
MSIQRKARSRLGGRWARALLLGASCTLAASAAGCTWDNWNLFGSKEPTPPGALESARLGPDGRLLREVPPPPELASAHELLRRGEYTKAEEKFNHIAENKDKKTPEIYAEEARYYEAECMRCQGEYPKAVDTYHKQLLDFPIGAHREQACKRMYDIANYWLDDTRDEMRLEKEKAEGKRSFIMPASFVHMEKSKPLLDEQGRALEALEQVTIHDPTGPEAPDALFLAGTVRFYNKDYQEADYLFSTIVERHPNSKYAPRALELAIIAKHMSTGGSDYDGRKSVQARQMILTAQDKYPELSVAKSEFLQRQLAGITKQQAEKDFKVAEFYRRTDHPGAAYFYYEIVRRRYPGTPFAAKASERMQDIGAAMQKKGRPLPAAQPAAPAPAQPPVGPGTKPAEQMPMPRTLGAPQPVPDVTPPLQPLPSNR